MNPARVLIVEDEGIVAEDLRLQMEDLGHEVVGIVVAGEDVVRVVEETGPDLVLMDIRLQNAVDGITAAEQLRARFDLPVIYVTAYADETVLQRARLTEPLGYLVKPIRRIELKVTVEMALYMRSVRVRLRAEEQCLKAIGDLAGGIAHDFNNLMTVVLGFSELLLSAWPADHPDREAVERIHSAAQRTSLLTSRLLAFARHSMLRIEQVEVNRLVKALVTQVSTGNAGNGVIHVHTSPGPKLVRADPSKLEEALGALIRSRVDAIPRGSSMTIKTGVTELPESFTRLHPEARAGRYAEITITDNAAPLSADQLRQLFVPDLRLDEDARVATGNSLALPAAHGTIRQLDGHIFPESSAERGTIFRVLLPLCQPSSGAQEDTTGSQG